MELNESAARAARAKALLDDPLLQNALGAHKTAIRDVMFALPTEAREQREFLFLQDKARQNFVIALELLLNDHQIMAAEYAMEGQLEARNAATLERVRSR